MSNSCSSDPEKVGKTKKYPISNSELRTPNSELHFRLRVAAWIMSLTAGVSA